MDHPEAINLVNEWFAHENWWFTATETDDKLIREKFGHLITDNVLNWDSTPKNHMARILIDDQIVRHCYRNCQADELFTWFAIRTAKDAISLGYDTNYTAAERCFMLLPFRHCGDISCIKFSLSQISQYEQHFGSHPMYNRFRVASLKKLSQVIDDQLIREGPMLYSKSENILNWAYIMLAILMLYFNLVACILITIILCLSLNRIKMFFFGSDFIRNRTLKIITKDYSFLNSNNVIYRSIRDTVLTLQKEGKIDRKLLVSLSGGVDSVCLLTTMIKMRQLDQIDSVIALHINYGNRYKSYWEEQFVKEYCAYHEVPLYIRRIDEVKRNRTHDRKIYEKLTHDIRFNLYRKIGLPVLLGHNRDDRIENIFTNIRKKMHYDNLFGMTVFSLNDGVKLVRPLLSHDKTTIYDYAKKSMITHTRNSTPNWSDRGRIRNILIPFLNKFDAGLENGLESLSKYLIDLSEQSESIVDNILSSIEHKENCAILKFQRVWRNTIWQKVIRHLCYFKKWPVPTNDSIDNFIKMINRTFSKGTFSKVKLTEKLWAIKLDDDVVRFFTKYDT